ncbi:MAG: hypothetical protein Q9207_002944 [Kuettlingeria erythrocarpa]
MAESPFKIVRGHGTFKCADYNVAWICALEIELFAARVLLDEQHATPSYNTNYDRNTYICGKIGEHKVVVACLPSGRFGNVNAGHLTGPMFHTFPNIKITLLVGIGGGVPREAPQDPLEDIYLGDVVIGWPEDGTTAVVQHDFGRWGPDGFVQHGSVDQPDWHLTQALTFVASNHELGQTNFRKSIARLQKDPRFASRRSDEDRLFQATYKHEGDYSSECRDCIATNLVERPGRAEARPDGLFRFHRGTIASGGAVIQDGETRDKLSKACNNARCMEMEAVGVNINSRCLVIRGLADYADSHKNDVWKYVAAGNAAAFAKEFLLTIMGSKLRELRVIVADQRKPISTLPGTFSRDPDFVGRDDVLKELDDYFTTTKCVTKTEIAVQYCHQHRQKTPECHIFWVYGSTRQSFDDAYRRIATELGIPGCDDPLFEHRKAVPSELDRRETGPWIMIIDNADDYSIYFPALDAALTENEQREYLAYCLPTEAENEGRVIVTTRNNRVGADIMGDSPIIEIPELAPGDARKLLRSKVPKEKWEDVPADMLLKELDYLPLAITQAAAFVKRNKLTSLKFYLGKLCSFHLNVQDVLSYNKLLDSRRQPGTPSAIFRTWQLSYHQIELENTQAANKLSLMAVLDNQAIPRILLTKRDGSEVVEMEALQVLLDFSLIKGDAEGEFFSMHPLQQLSTQHWLRLDGSRLKECEERGLVLLTNRMPRIDDNLEEQYTCSILLPHARIVVSYESNKLNYRSRLLVTVSCYEEWLGRYQDGYQHAVQAYEESIEAFGKTSEMTLDCEVVLCRALAHLERIDESTELFKDCRTKVDRFLKHKVDWNEAEVTLDSAHTLVLKRDPSSEAAAFTLLQKAMDLFRAYSNTESVLTCLDQQAFIMNRQEMWDKSESLYRQSLQESRGLPGTNRPEPFQYLNNIGLMVQRQGRSAEAAQFFRSAAAGREKIFGPEHPRTMESNMALSVALTDMCCLDEAESLGVRVLKYHQQNPDSHPSLIKNTMVHLTGLFSKLGKSEEANKLHRSLSFNFEIAPIAFGISSGRLSPTLDNLENAEHMLHKALEKSQAELGHEHSDKILKLDLLAQCLEMQDRWEAAENYRRQSLELYEHHEGKKSLDSVDSHLKLATNLIQQSKCEAALLHLQEVLERMKVFHPKETSQIQRMEEVCQSLLSVMPVQTEQEDVDRTNSDLRALLIPSRGNEHHPGSTASSAEVPALVYAQVTTARKDKF